MIKQRGKICSNNVYYKTVHKYVGIKQSSSILVIEMNKKFNCFLTMHVIVGHSFSFQIDNNSLDYNWILNDSLLCFLSYFKNIASLLCLKRGQKKKQIK